MAEDRSDEIICFCVSITRAEIKEATLAGDLNSLYEDGMSACCGSCRHEVTELIEEYLEECKVPGDLFKDMSS